MRVRTLLGAALVGLALWSSSGSVAHATVRVDNVQVPFHVRAEPGDEWTAFIFYRPQDCIPPGFNLATFFDVPRASGCERMTMTGFAIFDNDPMTDPGPRVAHHEDRGAVPIWFVRTSAYREARVDGLTLGELATLDPLRGTATFYRQVLRANNPPEAHFSALARGTPSEGRSSTYHTVRSTGAGHVLSKLKID